MFRVHVLTLNLALDGHVKENHRTFISVTNDQLRSDYRKTARALVDRFRHLF
jgi:hypothetical protein